MRFDRYQFSRLNIAETVLDLEHEEVSDLNFRYLDWIIREFNEEPGLRAFIREYKDRYVGSEGCSRGCSVPSPVASSRSSSGAWRCPELAGSSQSPIDSLTEW